MVPTARLELARPKSLPPQDSVSTNSTTSAKEHTLLRFILQALCAGYYFDFIVGYPLLSSQHSG